MTRLISVAFLLLLVSCGSPPEAAFDEVAGFDFVEMREDYEPFGSFRGESLELQGATGPLLLAQDDVELNEWRVQCDDQAVSAQVFLWSGSYNDWWLDDGGIYWDLVWRRFTSTEGEFRVSEAVTRVGEDISGIPSNPDGGIASHRYAEAVIPETSSNYLHHGAFVVSSYDSGRDQVRVAVVSGRRGDIDDPDYGLSDGEFTPEGFAADYEGPLMTRHVDCVRETWAVVESTLGIENS